MFGNRSRIGFHRFVFGHSIPHCLELPWIISTCRDNQGKLSDQSLKRTAINRCLLAAPATRASVDRLI
ncbi:MAG: hypothetical protein CMN98_04715 [Synechococcus sp. NP17]|nr:hypothetical protein [Synechococcus sp. NP17]